MGRVSGNTVFSCIATVGLGGIACFIAGIVFLSRAGADTRAAEIAEYNAAYDVWALGGAQSGSNQFRNAGPFQVTVDNTIALNLTTSSIEPAPVETGDGITPYVVRAAFTSTANPFSANVVPWNGGDVTRTFTIRDANGNVLTSTTVLLATVRSYSVSSRSSCRFGTKSGGRCHSSYYPSAGGVCLVYDHVQRTVTGGCALATADAADAWAQGTDQVIAGASNRVFQTSYTRVPGTSVTNFAWTDFPVTIRSSTDPWVYAAQATNGHMVFGIKSEAVRRTGIILISIGCALMAPYLLCFMSCCVKAAGKSIRSTGGTAGPRPTFSTAFRGEVQSSMRLVSTRTDLVVKSVSQRWTRSPMRTPVTSASTAEGGVGKESTPRTPAPVVAISDNDDGAFAKIQHNSNASHIAATTAPTPSAGLSSNPMVAPTSPYPAMPGGIIAGMPVPAFPAGQGAPMPYPVAGYPPTAISPLPMAYPTAIPPSSGGGAPSGGNGVAL